MNVMQEWSDTLLTSLQNLQTPSHGAGEDGSRTPGRTGAWDPTITNTPNPGATITLS